MDTPRERPSRWKWLLDSRGFPGPERLALLTLVVVMTFLFARTAIIGLRPHVEEEPVREALFHEVEAALECMIREVQAAGRADTEQDNQVLVIWHGAIHAEMEPRDVSDGPTRFYVNEDHDLVVEREDDTYVLAHDIKSIEFNPIYGPKIGLVLRAKAEGEVLDVRELLLLRPIHD